MSKRTNNWIIIVTCTAYGQKPEIIVYGPYSTEDHASHCVAVAERVYATCPDDVDIRIDQINHPQTLAVPQTNV